MTLSHHVLSFRPLSSLKVGSSFVVNHKVYYRGRVIRGTGKVRIYRDSSRSLSSQFIVDSALFVWAYIR